MALDGLDMAPFGVALLSEDGAIVAMNRRARRIADRDDGLVASLVGVENLKEHADKAGITLHTARWTLNRVQSKADCRSQADLVRMVRIGPAALDDGGND